MSEVTLVAAAGGHRLLTLPPDGASRHRQKRTGCFRWLLRIYPPSMKIVHFVCSPRRNSLLRAARENQNNQLLVYRTSEEDGQAPLVSYGAQVLASRARSHLTQSRRYFLLQRKSGVKSENGVDGRKTCVLKSPPPRTTSCFHNTNCRTLPSKL